MSGSEAGFAIDGAAKPESRALVALETSPRPAPASRREAAFLAHLIATQTQAPQTRLRRRAEPAEAVARYRAVAGLLG